MSVRLSWECGSGHFTANALHPFIKESTESLCACLVAHSWPVVDFSSSSAHEFMVPAGNLAYQSNAVSQRVLTKRRIIKASFPAMPPVNALKLQICCLGAPLPSKDFRLGCLNLGGKAFPCKGVWRDNPFLLHLTFFIQLRESLSKIPPPY